MIEELVVAHTVLSALYRDANLAMGDKGESGFEECMAMTRTLMRAIGVWPLDNAVVWPTCKFLSTLLSLIFFNIVPQIVKAIQVHSDFFLLIDLLTTAIINMSIDAIKGFTLWYYRAETKLLIVHIYSNWETTNVEEHQQEMWSTTRTAKRIIRFLVLWVFGLVIVFYRTFFKDFEANTIYTNDTSIRPLLLKGTFPVGFHLTPIYEITVAGQFLATALGTFAFAAYDGLYVSAVLHYSSQFYNLRRRLENLVKEHRLTNVPFDESLKSVVKRHMQLIRYANIIEETFNKTFLVQILLTSIALCFQGYQFIMLLSDIAAQKTIFIFTIFFTMANLTSIFAYCAIAQVIRNESENLLDGIYETEWYELPAKDAAMIVLVMARCTRPIEITAGKFAPLTLEYFTSILKTSAGYLSVLLAVKEKVMD